MCCHYVTGQWLAKLALYLSLNLEEDRLLNAVFMFSSEHVGFGALATSKTCFRTAFRPLALPAEFQLTVQASVTHPNLQRALPAGRPSSQN